MSTCDRCGDGGDISGKYICEACKQAERDAEPDPTPPDAKCSQELPGLVPEQLERLALLTEELGEAQQAIGKILRHGYESRHPDGGPSNRESLERELGDVVAALTLLTMPEDLSLASIERFRVSKLKRVQQYLHHQGEDLLGHGAAEFFSRWRLGLPDELRDLLAASRHNETLVAPGDPSNAGVAGGEPDEWTDEKCEQYRDGSAWDWGTTSAVISALKRRNARIRDLESQLAAALAERDAAVESSKSAVREGQARALRYAVQAMLYEFDRGALMGIAGQIERGEVTP